MITSHAASRILLVLGFELNSPTLSLRSRSSPAFCECLAYCQRTTCFQGRHGLNGCAEDGVRVVLPLPNFYGYRTRVARLIPPTGTVDIFSGQYKLRTLVRLRRSHIHTHDVPSRNRWPRIEPSWKSSGVPVVTVPRLATISPSKTYRRMAYETWNDILADFGTCVTSSLY